MEGSPIQDLIDLLNKLSEKYNFEEDDINEIRDKIFKLEEGDAALQNELDDFVEPEEDDGNETHIEED